MLSEDGMQCSQSPGWSRDVMLTHLKFSARSDAILGFSNFLQVLSTAEGKIVCLKMPRTMVHITVP